MAQLHRDHAIVYLMCKAEGRGLRFPISVSRLIEELVRNVWSPSAIRRGTPRGYSGKWGRLRFRRRGPHNVFDTRDLDAWFDSIEENLCVATPRTFSIQRTLDKLH